jgi:hypothetical protein
MRGVTTAKRSRRAEGSDRTPRDRHRKTKLNVRGKSGDPNRGCWCTACELAKALGRFDIDPFSNPRSHIESDVTCMLENGGNGLLNPKAPGTWRSGSSRVVGCADENTRVFLQPPYSIVPRAIAHYGHTRFTALLRFDPRPEWFKRLYRLSELVCVLWHCEFEPPPGVDKGGGNSFPHALFYRRAADVTDAVLRRTIAWRTNHGT